MKWFLVLVMTSILAVCLVAGCGGGVKTYVTAIDQWIDAYNISHIEKTIVTRVNQQFIIVLDSNPTTGYEWEESYDEGMLKLVESKFQRAGRRPKGAKGAKPAKPPEEGLVGVGGTQYFRFKALETGKTEITFTYKRAWETDLAEQRVFSVDIK